MDRTTRVQGVASAKYISMFCFIMLLPRAFLHLFLAAAWNGACDLTGVWLLANEQPGYKRAVVFT